ncbi:hypothetical protein EDB89DRAFT_1955872 [Lactarius sanguifluus]|nr:hypothetical protein EDB89DRAFT_1955872 [Lactarius sanguifluus]
MLNEWKPDTPYKLGHTIQFEGEKYQILMKHVSSREKTPRNSPDLYGIPDKFAANGGAWYESNALLGSDWDVERPGLAPGGYPRHQSDEATNPRGNNGHNTSPSVFSWTTAKEVASDIKHMHMFPKARETAPGEKGEGVTAPLLVGKAGHAVPDSIAGSVRESSANESLYGGEESSIMSGINLKHD